MKKIKSFKTLASLGAVATLTPLATAGCSKVDKPQPEPTPTPEPTVKTNIDTFNWSKQGNYLITMTNSEIVQVFKDNNITGQGNLPTDIYQNVNVVATGNGENRTITISVDEINETYTGTYTTNITAAKININTFHWNDIGNYDLKMSENDVIVEFKKQNPAGRNGVPKDIYDSVNIVPKLENLSLNISLETITTSQYYTGSIKINIAVSGYLVLNDTTYILSELIDVNAFCGKNALNIPLKNGNYLSIPDHSKITELSLVTSTKSTKINDNFLFGCTSLTNLNISSLKEATEIGNSFLENCSNLAELNLTLLSNVKTIGANFLNGCSSLPKDINLEPIYNVTEIGGLGLPQLESIDLTNFKNLTKINGGFLSGCNKITSLDLSTLNNVSSVGDNFLYNCSLLTSLDASCFTNVNSIGSCFLTNCVKLNQVNLPSLWNVKEIKSDFLSGCSSLEIVKFDCLNNINTIGDNFLWGCSKLISFPLNKLNNVETIGSNFLASVNYQSGLDLNVLSKQVTTGTGFLGNWSNLQTLDISGWNINTKVEDDFLNTCINLNCIKLPSYQGKTNDYLINALKTIFSYDWWKNTNNGFFVCPVDEKAQWAEYLGISEGIDNYIIEKNEGCMYYWDRRWKLPLEATPNNFDGEKWHVPVDDRSNSWLTILPEDKYRVTQIYFPANPTVTDLQDNILEGATNLRLVDFTSLNTITSIGSNFLLSCSILNFVDLGNLVNVTTVNKSFLTGCDNLKQLNVFNKDPNTFTTDPEGFMDTVSGDCIIRANNLVNEYKDVDPWKSRADHIYE